MLSSRASGAPLSSRASEASRGICTRPAPVRSGAEKNDEFRIRSDPIVPDAHVLCVYPREPLADSLHRRDERHREATRTASRRHQHVFRSLSLRSAGICGNSARRSNSDRSGEAAQAVATREESRVDRSTKSGVGRPECRSLDFALRAPLGMTPSLSSRASEANRGICTRRERRVQLSEPKCPISFFLHPEFR